MFERTIGIVILLPLLAGFAVAQAQDLEEIVRRQGEELQRLKTEIKGLRGQNVTAADGLGRDIDAYLDETKPATSKSVVRSAPQRMRVGGYFSLELRDDGDDENLRYDQYRLVLKIQGDIAAGIGFDTEIEIEGGGADVPFLTGNEILVEYAEVSFELIEDALLFKVGVILMPWGRFNQFHDDPMNDLTDRPLVSRRIGLVAFGQPGLAVEGTVELGSGGWFLDYDVAVVQGLKDGASTNGGLRGARNSFREDNNQNKQVFGRVVIDIPVGFLDLLEVGGSGTYGKWDDAGANAIYGWAAEVFIKKGKFEFTGEYMNVRLDQDPGAAVSEPRRMDGWYLQFSYHFFPNSWRGTYVLFTKESTFTFVVRVEAIDLNHATTGSTFRDDLRQLTIGINFRPVERAVMRVEYKFVDTKEAGFTGSADQFIISWATFF